MCQSEKQAVLLLLWVMSSCGSSPHTRMYMLYCCTWHNTCACVEVLSLCKLLSDCTLSSLYHLCRATPTDSVIYTSTALNHTTVVFAVCGYSYQVYMHVVYNRMFRVHCCSTTASWRHQHVVLSRTLSHQAPSPCRG